LDSCINPCAFASSLKGLSSLFSGVVGFSAGCFLSEVGNLGIKICVYRLLLVLVMMLRVFRLTFFIIASLLTLSLVIGFILGNLPISVTKICWLIDSRNSEA